MFRDPEPVVLCWLISASRKRIRGTRFMNDLFSETQFQNGEELPAFPERFGSIQDHGSAVKLDVYPTRDPGSGEIHTAREPLGPTAIITSRPGST